MLVEIEPSGDGFVVRIDRSYWPASRDWCPQGGRYYPALRWVGACLGIPGIMEMRHASIPVYRRRWVFGPKIFYRICPSCDFRERYTP